MFDISGWTLEQKVGQLFIAPFSPDRGEDHRADWQVLIETYHLGGVLIKAGKAIDVANGIASLQMSSETPLLVAADSEWGLGMRVADAMSFPKAGDLALTHPDLIRQMAEQIAMQGKLLGIHLHLGPVADVNCNPRNPVIGRRSFGADPALVGELVAAYVTGIESTGALSCPKHFPGHGDTSIDSHVDLPLILHPRDRLEHVEWIPFQRAIHSGASALMTAHLFVPALDSALPTTLSPCTPQLIRDEFHFSGLVVTDALNMKALRDRSPGEIARLAFQAGHDLLLYGAHLIEEVDELMRVTIPAAYQSLLGDFRSGTLSVEELDRRVERILEAKERAHWLPYLGDDLDEKLHAPEAVALRDALAKP